MTCFYIKYFHLASAICINVKINERIMLLWIRLVCSTCTKHNIYKTTPGKVYRKTTFHTNRSVSIFSLHCIDLWYKNVVQIFYSVFFQFFFFFSSIKFKFYTQINKFNKHNVIGTKYISIIVIMMLIIFWSTSVVSTFNFT